MTFWVHFAPMKMTIKHAILMAVQVIFDLNQARVIEYDVNTPNQLTVLGVPGVHGKPAL